MTVDTELTWETQDGYQLRLPDLAVIETKPVGAPATPMPSRGMPAPLQFEKID